MCDRVGVERGSRCVGVDTEMDPYWRSCYMTVFIFGDDERGKGA